MFHLELFLLIAKFLFSNGPMFFTNYTNFIVVY